MRTDLEQGLLQAAFPVPRPPTVVRDGENADASRRIEVDDVDTGNALQRGVEPASRAAFAEPEHQPAASPRSDQWWRQRRRRTQVPSALADFRTIDLPSDIRRQPRPQSERGGSPPAKFRFRPASNVCPGNARGFPGHDAAGSPRDLGGPGCFYVGRMLGFRVVQAGQEFGRDISALVERQREGVPQKFLRS